MSTSDTAKDIAFIEPMISKSDSTVSKKRYSNTGIYEQYLDSSLLSYLDKNHPAWSIPNQNMWYPQLFEKYKDSGSLVNYLSGDFNCDGLKDYALLLDKGNNMLAAVAFFKKGKSYTTEELTEFSYSNTEKIEDHIKAFAPGNYKIADPDVAIKDRQVKFKCTAVGVGHFNELYEGGKDVFYWDKNELRSCLIED